MSQQSIESIYSNAGKVKTYEATESVMKPRIVGESHEKFRPLRNASTKSGPAHTYEAGEDFMKYSIALAKLTPQQFGAYVKLATVNEKAAKNWLHSIGDGIDSVGQGIYNAGKAVYDTGAAVNRGVRNTANSAYNYGQSVARIPGQLYKGFTGGLSDQRDVFGSGNYGVGTTATQRAPGAPRVPSVRPPRPTASGRAWANQTGAPAPAPAPQPAAPAPQPLSQQLGRPVATNPATGKPNLSWAEEQQLRNPSP